jgi:hypothetical protein
MSSLAEQWKALARDAGRLGDEKFLQVFKLLEQLGSKTDVNPALDLMRPRLAELRPVRRISLSRLFFHPVEDLLDNPDSYRRKINRVSRATLPGAWAAVKGLLDPSLVSAANEGLAATSPRDGAALVEVGRPLWAAGSAALVEVVERAQAEMKWRLELFGRDEDVLRQLGTIREVTEIGGEIEALKIQLPERPIGELAESHTDTIKAALADVGQESARRAAPLLLVLTSRMMRPGDLLKMLSEVRMGGDSSVRDEVSRDLSGYVVSNLLRQTSEIERTHEGAEPGISDLALTAERLSEGLNSVNETVQSLRDAAMSDKVKTARTEIGNFVMRSIVGDVDKNVMGLLKAPDGGVPNDEQLVQAENFALALRRSAKLAGFLGIQREVNAKITQLREDIGRESSTLRKRGDLNGDEARRQIFGRLRLIEILAGSDEAERLYRQWSQG